MNIYKILLRFRRADVRAVTRFKRFPLGTAIVRNGRTYVYSKMEKTK